MPPFLSPFEVVLAILQMLYFDFVRYVLLPSDSQP